MSSLTMLPKAKQSRTSLDITPLNARVMLASTPKCGKTTLASEWAPDTTLIIDTQHGTDLLPGEHYVQHVTDWTAFASTVDKLCEPGHTFKTVVIDMVDDVWRFVDRYYAGPNKALATATDDYGRSAKQAEGEFTKVIGKLLATDMGVWFLTHAKPVEEGNLTRYVPKLDGKVLTYVNGVVQFVFLAETLGPKRVLHTQPSAKFEAGSRVPLPEPMEMDARQLYAAMARGLRPPKTETNEENAA
jgi:hypothetical protein